MDGVESGQGTVFLARDKRSDAHAPFNVVVKTMTPTRNQLVDVGREVTLHKELKDLDKSKSKNIVTMVDFFVTKQGDDLIKEVAMVFEYYPDGNLQMYADCNHPLDNADIKVAAQGVAEAFATLHAMGYVSYVIIVMPRSASMWGFCVGFTRQCA